MSDNIMRCFYCGGEITITRFVDWDTLSSVCYPYCRSCGWSSKRSFETERAAEDHFRYLEYLYEQGKYKE